MLITLITVPLLTEVRLAPHTPGECLPLHQLNKNLRILISRDLTSNSLVYHPELDYQTHTIQRQATTLASSLENTQAQQHKQEISHSVMAVNYTVSCIQLELGEHCQELTRTV